MRVVSCRVGWCGLVWIGLTLTLHQPAMAEPPTTNVTALEEAAPQDAEPSPSVEAASSLASEPSPSVGTAPATDDAADNGKKSIFRAVFRNIETAFTLTTGVRKDDFQWSIAGNSAGANPNVLSELTWSDVDSYQLTLTNRTSFNHNLYARGELNYAAIQNGRIQDSDYRLDDRGDEYSRSVSDCSGDQIWDISLAAGYPFFFFQERLLVAPLLGYAYHKQNFRITDGEQVVTWTSGPALGPLDGLNSTYQSSWAGPWVGCDLRYSLPGSTGDRLPMEFGLSIELHYADYEAEANWNLRADFEHPTSFRHQSTGYGTALAAEWLIDLNADWDFVFRTTYQYWETSDGKDQAFKSDGSVERTRLNEVEWSNHSFMVGANFHF